MYSIISIVHNYTHTHTKNGRYHCKHILQFIQINLLIILTLRISLHTCIFNHVCGDD